MTITVSCIKVERADSSAASSLSLMSQIEKGELNKGSGRKM